MAPGLPVLNMGRRIIVGVSGASGAILAWYAVNALREQDIEVHLTVSDAAARTWEIETSRPFSTLTDCADVWYDCRDMTAAIASGTFATMGMLIVPCSMKTLAGIVTGYTDNLLLRAADVCLKEGWPVVLCPRETPLGKVHLRNLCAAADLGCAIVPPMLSFYSGQDTVEDQIHHIVGKLLVRFGLDYPVFRPWEGVKP